MYNHNKAQQSKHRVHISWDILYDNTPMNDHSIEKYLHQKITENGIVIIVSSNTFDTYPMQYRKGSYPHTNIGTKSIMPHHDHDACTTLLNMGCLYHIRVVLHISLHRRLSHHIIYYATMPATNTSASICVHYENLCKTISTFGVNDLSLSGETIQLVSIGSYVSMYF